MAELFGAGGWHEGGQESDDQYEHEYARVGREQSDVGVSAGAGAMAGKALGQEKHGLVCSDVKRRKSTSQLRR